MKFILVIGFVIILLLIAEMILEKIYMKSEKYKKTLGGCDKFYNVPDNIEICNIGSGPGMYAISYDDCGKCGFNFSTAPQSYTYGFRILERFKKCIKENSIVIIVIMSPLSFGDNNAYKNKSYSDKFYGILSPEAIDNYSSKRALMLKHPLLMNLFKKIKSKFSSQKRNNQTIENNEPKVVSVWKKEFNLHDLSDEQQAVKHAGAFNEKIETILKGIELCLSQKWKPVFVIPPVPQEIRNYIGEEFQQAFVYDNLEQIQKVYPQIPLLNYYDDCRFVQELFKSGVFLNEKGRDAFSTILFEDINKEFSEG